MPQLNGGGGDDLGANDEMIAFKDEGDHEEKIREENAFTSDLADLKSSLVNESEINSSPAAAVIRRGHTEDHRVYTDKRQHLDEVAKHQDGGMYKPAYSGYPFLMLPESYLPNGPVSPSSNKVSVVQQGMHPLTSLLPYDHFSPSPSHIPTDISQKTGTAFSKLHSPHFFAFAGVQRHQSQEISGFYSLPQGQITPPMNWSNQPVYPLPSCGFRQSFPSSLQPGSSYPSATARYCSSAFTAEQSETLPCEEMSGMHPTGIPHPAIVPPSGKQEHDHYERSMYLKPHPEGKREKEPKKTVIKKPLNAFMLYMKEMRAKVIAECTLKESAAINQILGRRWHALTREEQAKYYELARKERQLHMQLYPSWSARDNYVAGAALPNCSPGGEAEAGPQGKKKRRKRDKQHDSSTDPGSPKKCRARFGLNQQTDWCGPCRRKKKCIRYLQRGLCASPHSSDGSAIDSPPSAASPPHCSSSCPASPVSSPCPQSLKRPSHPARPSLDLNRVKTENTRHQSQ
ncbi:Transcription factor 7-like 2 HMG box transcription factor 4 T-cell-specific transcription factor 4 [Triplophysa tibetana]|uniref:Transcription factor 7-like 2 HMG box transcription factor 4 T-cell-specific transcription factor 4 n=1 Tax=Triplophysa tibetana TaxID=1572043 RepID=A0A5A9PHQ3_9TELE|nr:Transcription factor 7-like 2 HMG box transcription factor 4 T-cell-specific transcription factor 4 [Triplophysa tibetana]